MVGKEAAQVIKFANSYGYIYLSSVLHQSNGISITMSDKTFQTSMYILSLQSWHQVIIIIAQNLFIFILG